MRWLQTLFRRGDATCPHSDLAPNWSGPEDIGDADLFGTFRCEVCSLTFTPDELRELARKPAAR